MRITPQTNCEGLAPFAAKRLGHEPSMLFWLLVAMVDKCPGIDIYAVRALYKDLFSSRDIECALADLKVIAPLWGLEPPVRGGNSYGYYDD